MTTHPDSNDSDATSKNEALVNWSLLDDPAIIDRCRNCLREDGVMVLRNFATNDGLNRLKAEVLSVPYNDSRQYYTPWQDQGDFANYPPSHPRNLMMHSSAAFVGRKTLEQEAKDRLCVSISQDDDRLLRFLSCVANKMLHRSTDENGSIYAYRIHPNHEAPWHFDESPYTAILYLQNSEGGGEFEYVPWCRPTTRKDDEKGHEVVKAVLMDVENKSTNANPNGVAVKRVVAEPGSLLFFNGARSFHRAAPITGPTNRLGLVFTYAEAKGFTNSDGVRDSNEWDPAIATSMKLEG